MGGTVRHRVDGSWGLFTVFAIFLEIYVIYVNYVLMYSGLGLSQAKLKRFPKYLSRFQPLAGFSIFL